MDRNREDAVTRALANSAPLVSREFDKFVTFTNNRTHVINLPGDAHGEEIIHLLPGVPHNKVPEHFLDHPVVAGLLENGQLTAGASTANPEAAETVADVDFANPEGTKAKGRAKAAARAKAAKEAEGGDGADGGTAAGAGGPAKPWDK